MYKYVFFAITVLFIAGCQNTVTTSDQPGAAGLRYALPLDRLRFTVVTTDDYSDKIEFQKKGEAEVIISNNYSENDIKDYYNKCYKVPDPVKTGKISEIQKVLVADWSGNYSIRIDPGAFQSGAFDIKREATGMLSSVHLNSTGKAGETIVNVAKLVGTVYGYSLTGGVSAAAAALENIPENQNLGDNQALVSSEKPKSSCKTIRLSLINNNKLDDDIKPELSDTYIEIALFKRYLDKKIFKDIKKTKSIIVNTESMISEITHNIGRAKKYSEIVKLENKRKKLQGNKAYLEAELVGYQAVIAAAKNRVGKMYKITADKSDTQIIDTDLSALMSSCPSTNDNYESCQTTPISPEQISDQMIKNIFENAGIGVTLSRVTPNKYVSIEEMPNHTGILSTESYIAYRDSEPFVLNFYQLQEEKVDAETTIKKWVPIKRELHSLVSSTSPVGMIRHETNMWAKRDLNLTYTNGLLSGYVFNVDSGAEKLSEQLSEASTKYISSVKSAQTSRLEIESANRKAALEQLTFQVDSLKKQKELLEAKNAINTLTSTQAVELASIQDQIDLLDKQRELIESQLGYDTDSQTAASELQQAIAQQELLTLQAQAQLQAQGDTSNNIGTQLLVLQSIADIKAQLVGNENSQELLDKIQKLEIQLELLEKELELKGVVE